MAFGGSPLLLDLAMAIFFLHSWDRANCQSACPCVVVIIMASDIQAMEH